LYIYEMLSYYGVKLFSHIVNFFRLRAWKDAVVSL
jgi:hypothetical protein